MLQFCEMARKKNKRPYRSKVRQRQAGDTRRRVVEATRQLLQSEGYAGMTIEAIAQRAEVSAQTVYAIFKSKTGRLVELLDQAAFGADYEDSVRQAMSTTDPESRLRFAARIARHCGKCRFSSFLEKQRDRNFTIHKTWNPTKTSTTKTVGLMNCTNLQSGGSVA